MNDEARLDALIDEALEDILAAPEPPSTLAANLRQRMYAETRASQATQAPLLYETILESRQGGRLDVHYRRETLLIPSLKFAGSRVATAGRQCEEFVTTFARV